MIAPDYFHFPHLENWLTQSGDCVTVTLLLQVTTAQKNLINPP